MLFLMLYAPLMKYWSDGPMWPQKGVEINECEGNWWQNLLYINNLIDPEKMVRYKPAQFKTVFSYKTFFLFLLFCLIHIQIMFLFARLFKHFVRARNCKK